MHDEANRHHAAIVAFRALHADGCFLLPNPWDAGAAVLLEHLGFKAIASTSAGYAFSQALPDAVDALTRDDVLAHLRQLTRATALPVNADFQNGYADEPSDVAANVALCIATGVAGLSIEDATGDAAAPLYDRALAIDRVRAARAAIDASGLSVVLTARCEAFLVGAPEATRIALDRAVAFAEAGADCVFAPGMTAPADIVALVRAVAPVPVNAIVFAPDPQLTVARLADLGVRRISVGSALSRVAYGAFLRAARRILTDGVFDDFGEAATFAELNGIFRVRTAPRS